MPKVTEEHIAARREQILAAAQTCFARKGFHAASMNDVFAESGLSAGAVYSYFKSKDEIVVALAGRAMELLGPFFERILAEEVTPSLEEVLARFTAYAGDLPDGPMGIAPQVWAMATYNSDIQPAVVANIKRLRGYWVELARRDRDAGRLAVDADVEAVGGLLFSVMPGFMFQHLLIGDLPPDSLRRGLADLRRPAGG